MPTLRRRCSLGATRTGVHLDDHPGSGSPASANPEAALLLRRPTNVTVHGDTLLEAGKDGGGGRGRRSEGSICFREGEFVRWCKTRVLCIAISVGPYTKNSFVLLLAHFFRVRNVVPDQLVIRRRAAAVEAACGSQGVFIPNLLG